MSANECPVLAPPPASLTDIVWGQAMTQAAYVAAKLGIVDVLQAGPPSSSERRCSPRTGPIGVTYLHIVATEP